MHKFTKLMLVVGTVLTLISFIVMVIGYGFAFDQILEEDDEEKILSHVKLMLGQLRK